MIPWLTPDAPFPDVACARPTPYNGLLAATDTIGTQRLLTAYQRGIFPWYSQGEPVLWWSPDPRMVLYSAELKISRSLRKRLREVLADPSIAIRVDTAFEKVMRACAQPRPGQSGTWITNDIVAAYGGLYQQGLAHSVEIWRDTALIGGLYGVGIGRMFYGESMFALQPDASKVALTALVQIMLESNVPLIDCQQKTAHLASMGAREVSRPFFCAYVAQAVDEVGPDWHVWRDFGDSNRIKRLLQLYSSPQAQFTSTLELLT